MCLLSVCALICHSILRYSVIPLSTNSGLIGWVPDCDTLHALIREYRDKKKILLNIEHRIMLRVGCSFVTVQWFYYALGGLLLYHCAMILFSCTAIMPSICAQRNKLTDVDVVLGYFVNDWVFPSVAACRLSDDVEV